MVAGREGGGRQKEREREKDRETERDREGKLCQTPAGKVVTCTPSQKVRAAEKHLFSRFHNKRSVHCNWVWLKVLLCMTRYPSLEKYSDFHRPYLRALPPGCWRRLRSNNDLLAQRFTEAPALLPAHGVSLLRVCSLAKQQTQSQSRLRGIFFPHYVCLVCTFSQIWNQTLHKWHFNICSLSKSHPPLFLQPRMMKINTNVKSFSITHKCKLIQSYLKYHPLKRIMPSRQCTWLIRSAI